MRMDQITKDEVEKLEFPGSASNGNNALRTLRRMYSKAKEHKMIFEVPDFALFKEHGRSLRLNDEAERRLSAVAHQPDNRQLQAGECQPSRSGRISQSSGRR